MVVESILNINYLLLIVMLLFSVYSYGQEDKTYYAFGFGFTGNYGNLVKGGSWALYTEKLYFGVNFNSDWHNTENHDQEYLIGYNTRKVHYTHNIIFKKIPSFDLYATFYAGYHNIQNNPNNISMGTRFNLLFRDIPLGLYLDANKDGRMAYGLIVKLN